MSLAMKMKMAMNTVGRRPSVVARGYDRQVQGSAIPVEPVGDRIAAWIATPFDLLSFGPRAGMGALVSAPERLQRLSSDMERAMELLQDPRPINEKQEALLREFEATMVEFLEKGAVVETDVLANIKTVLPAEAANMLSELIPEPPNKAGMGAASAYDMGSEMPVGPPITYAKSDSGPRMLVELRCVFAAAPHGADVAASQAESEVTEIKHAVMGLKSSLEEIRANTDPSQVNIVKLNLKEARDMLARRLYEVSGDAADSLSVASAVREAGILLDEVNAQFFD
ncbi:hypothetical protein FOA52_006264 [Chlamydomonas sp. UWO 241]|nr:hypothetical protein FOA52_006264 [Chlamydomonas sp. UWO 241]